MEVFYVQLKNYLKFKTLKEIAVEVFTLHSLCLLAHLSDQNFFFRIKFILKGNTFLCVRMWGQKFMDFKKYLLKMDLNFRLII